MTPTSNVRLGVTPTLRLHPLVTLTAAGVRCSISTDDPAILDTTLAQEYAIARDLGLTDADAFAAGLSGALCDDAARASLAELGRRAYRPAGGNDPSHIDADFS